MRVSTVDSIFQYKHPLQCKWCLYWKKDDPNFGKCRLTGTWHEGEEWCEKCTIDLRKRAKDVSQ